MLRSGLFSILPNWNRVHGGDPEQTTVKVRTRYQKVRAISNNNPEPKKVEKANALIMSFRFIWGLCNRKGETAGKTKFTFICQICFLY